MFILARSIHDKVTAGVQSIRRCVGGAGRMHVYFRLVALLLALGGAGCLLIQSATRGMASQSCFSRLQMVWLLFGLIFLSACFLFPRSFYKRHLGVILGLIYALLWGVLVFGVKIQGARSWYRFHGFCMQPSELAKPAFLSPLPGSGNGRKNGRVRGALLPGCCLPGCGCCRLCCSQTGAPP